METALIFQKTARAIQLLWIVCLIGCLFTLRAHAQTSEGLPKRTFNINPLGLLQFGPIVQGEFKVNDRGYLVPHVRIPYLGILYHVINWDDGSDEVSISPLALGLGGGYKVLFPVEKGAWYLGGALDYSFGSSSGTDGAGSWDSKFQNVAIMSNGGFRWRSTRKRSVLSVGAYVGVSLPVQDEWTGSRGDSGDDRTIIPMGMLELSFGWESN